MILMLVVLLVIQLAGCTSNPSSAEFPIGLFDCVECDNFTMRFFDDGTLTVYSQGEKWFTGKWSVEGDTFFTGDSLCFDKEIMPASYTWHFDGSILTLKVIKDECSDRVDSLDGKPWKLITE